MKKKYLSYLSAFTLVELVVSIVISSIILLWIMKILGEVVYELSYSTQSSKLHIEMVEVNKLLADRGNKYHKKTLLIDEIRWEWTDVVLFYNEAETQWIIYGIINPETLKIFTGSTYSQYNKKHLWYREVNESEISTLFSTPLTVYSYSFFPDKIHSQIYISDFQVQLYNVGSILDIHMSFILNYTKEKWWMEWEDLPKDNIYSLNLNF